MKKKLSEVGFFTIAVLVLVHFAFFWKVLTRKGNSKLRKWNSILLWKDIQISVKGNYAIVWICNCLVGNLLGRTNRNFFLLYTYTYFSHFGHQTGRILKALSWYWWNYTIRFCRGKKPGSTRTGTWCKVSVIICRVQTMSTVAVHMFPPHHCGNM